jgi:hypothetical protein
MAVRYVVDKLLHRPAALAIGRVKLTRVQAVHGLSQKRRQLGERCKGIDTIGWSNRFGSLESSDGKTWVRDTRCCCHCLAHVRKVAYTPFYTIPERRSVMPGLHYAN